MDTLAKKKRARVGTNRIFVYPNTHISTYPTTHATPHSPGSTYIHTHRRVPGDVDLVRGRGTEFLGTVENTFLGRGPLTRFHIGNRFFPIRDFLCFTLMVSLFHSPYMGINFVPYL